MRKSPLLKGTATYAGTTLANSSIPFLLLPVLTRYLSPEDLGMISIFSMTSVIIQTLVLFNANGAVVSQFYRVGLEESKQLSRSGFFLMSIVAICVLAATIVMHMMFSSLWGLSLPWTIGCVLIASLNAAFTFGLKIQQMQEKALSYAKYQVSLASTSAAISLYLVIVKSAGWQGRAGAMIISSAICGAVMITNLRRHGWIRVASFPTRKALKPVLDYSLPLLPHSLAGLASSMADRMYIGFLSTTATLGIYSVGTQLTSILSLAFGAYNLAFTPWLFRKLSTKDVREYREARIATVASCAGIVISGIALATFLPLVLPLFVGNRFASAAQIIPILLGAAAFDAMAKMFQFYLAFAQVTGKISQITVAGLIIAAVLMTYLVPRYAATGAASALLITNMFVFLLSLRSALGIQILLSEALEKPES